MVMKDVATVMCWVKEASSRVIAALSSSGLYLLHRVLQGIKPSIYGAINFIYVLIHFNELLIQRIEFLSNVPIYKFSKYM